MKVIYIAGSYRAENAWEVEQNIRRAENMAMELAKLGLSFICPHTNSRFFDGTITSEYWIEMTKELLRRCDAVLVLPFYEDSEGTIGEIEEAHCLIKPVLYNVEQLKDWLEDVES